MPQIEIDFDVFKALTNKHATESVTCNDVIRELLGLRPGPSQGANASANGSRPWTVSDTTFPHGTEFTADHKGKTYSGLVKDGKLELSDGHRFSTPSAAAVHITNTTINGWRFWRCRLPGQPQFVLIERLRGKAHS